MNTRADRRRRSRAEALRDAKPTSGAQLAAARGSASTSKPKENMNEEKAYEKLQELLGLAEELKNAGRYSTDEIIDEIRQRLGE